MAGGKIDTNNPEAVEHALKAIPNQIREQEQRILAADLILTPKLDPKKTAEAQKRKDAAILARAEWLFISKQLVETNFVPEYKTWEEWVNKCTNIAIGTARAAITMIKTADPEVALEAERKRSRESKQKIRSANKRNSGTRPTVPELDPISKPEKEPKPMESEDIASAPVESKDVDNTNYIKAIGYFDAYVASLESLNAVERAMAEAHGKQWFRGTQMRSAA